MSLRAVHAGTGYQYLLRSVATHDGPKDQGQSLSDYYAAKGTPAGRWIGDGVAGFESETAKAGEVINESQMAALYGEGLHPDTDALLASGVKLATCKLGRAMPIYTQGRGVLDALATAEKSFRSTHNRLPTVVERSALAERIGRPFYLSEGGYEHASGADVVAWVNRQRDQVKQAVSGFDFTFSPVKSVSVLWGLADQRTASQIAALHHEAVAETLAWAQDNVLFTRQGAGGIEQVRTRGMIAAEFTHFDTRGGDPDLHSHVLVSNKVQDSKGDWKALDGQPIFQMHQAMSARYNTALQDRLTRRMGIEFEKRYPSADKAAVWEVAGVDGRLNEVFSSRRREAKPRYDQLVSDFVVRHGRQPSQRAAYGLWQQAILETRNAKKPAQSLDTHRENWHATAVNAVGDEAVEQLVESVRRAAGTHQVRPMFDPGVHTDAVAEKAIAAVLDKRSQFRRSHVDTAVSVALKEFRFASGEQRQCAHESITDYALDQLSVRLTPPEPLVVPAALRTDSGAVIDRRVNATVFTTQAVLDTEELILEACRQPVAVMAPGAAVDAALAAHQRGHGWMLNAGQEELARYLTGCGTVVAAGVGPAGTGKTTAMSVVVQAWAATGGSVIALAPSAAAASVLSEDIGSAASTIDSLVFTWRGNNPHRAGGDLESLPVHVGRGDMILVDEAGMASTDQLAALTEIAQAAGAVVRMVGDPAQLESVGRGGVFGEICRTAGTPELTQVVRMGADVEQAAATLGLRRGDDTALELYHDRGWLTGGDRSAVLADAIAGYLADTERGRQSLIIAATNADVDDMNEVIRAHHIAAGSVDTAVEVTVSRGDRVAVGDRVITRRNTVLDTSGQHGRGGGVRVSNGQMFTVTGIGEDGALAVKDTRSGERMMLPAQYARDHVHLGYAATVHRSQGATVDTAHAVIDSSVDRHGLYVAMTRGRHENRVYAVCETQVDRFAEDGHLHSAGDTPAPSPMDMLAGVVRHDHRDLSATEALRSEYATATSDERLDALYRHGVATATATYIDYLLPELLDGLPKTVAQLIDSHPQHRAALRAAMVAATNAGIDPADHWLEATASIESRTAPALAIASMLTGLTPGREPGQLPAIPPRCPGDDGELHAWLTDHHTRMTITVATTGRQLANLVDQYTPIWERVATEHARLLLDQHIPDEFYDSTYWDMTCRILAVAGSKGDPVELVNEAVADCAHTPGWSDNAFAQALLRSHQRRRSTAPLPSIIGAFPLPGLREGMDTRAHTRAHTLLEAIGEHCHTAATRTEPWHQRLPEAPTAELATTRKTLISHIAVWRSLHHITTDTPVPDPHTTTDTRDRTHETLIDKLASYRSAVAAATHPERALSDTELAEQIEYLYWQRQRAHTNLFIAHDCHDPNEPTTTNTEHVQARITTLITHANLIDQARRIDATGHHLSRQPTTPTTRAQLEDLAQRYRDITAQLPPPDQWDHIQRRAADTTTHTQQLNDARDTDTQRTRRITKATTELNSLTTQLDTHQNEQHRRAALTPHQRAEERQQWSDTANTHANATISTTPLSPAHTHDSEYGTDHGYGL